LRSLPRIGFATLVMTAALWAMASGLEPSLALPSPTGVRFAALGALVAAGLLVYGIAILASGVIDRRQLRNLLRRSGSAGPA
jgi:hypothetical protein